jgi:hypothetical protein
MNSHELSEFTNIKITEYSSIVTKLYIGLRYSHDNLKAGMITKKLDELHKFPSL